MKNPIVFLSALLLTVACSPAGDGEAGVRVGSFGPAGTAEVHGTLHGETMEIASAISSRINFTDGTGIGVVLLSDYPNFCSHLSGGHQPPNARVITIVSVVSTGTSFGAPTVPGDYDVIPFADPPPAGHVSNVDFYHSTATCGGVSDPLTEGVSGTVTITNIGSTYTGKADFTTAQGEEVKATFTPSLCNAQALFNWLNESLPCQ